MSLKKNQLTVPSERDILQATDADQKCWNEIKIVPGNTILHKGYYFHGFSVCTGKIETIRDADMQLKQLHGRKIACDYRLPRKNFHLMQDFMDEYEHAAGKSLLSMLSAAKIFNRAVFVVRYYGGVHLGPSCFQAHVEAAQSATTHDPYNPFTKHNQTPWPVQSQQPQQHSKASASTNLANHSNSSDHSSKPATHTLSVQG